MAGSGRKWTGRLILGLCLALAGSVPAVARSPSPPPAGLERPAPASAPVARAVYHCNLKSKKFHRPGCRYYHCPNCQVVFGSWQEALTAGYAPCTLCRP